MTSIIFSLPFIINPIGVILIRRQGGTNVNKVSDTEFESLMDSDEQLTMIMAELDQQELEKAIFTGKTTTL